MANLSFISPMFAYFDPGSASLVMQAIVGGSAGLFVLAKYLWNAVPNMFRGHKPADKANLNDVFVA